MPKLRFYHPSLTHGRIVLSPEESHHAGSVLRCSVGDRAWLFDGQGREAFGHIADTHRGAVAVDVEQLREPPTTERIRLTLAVAMPRNQRQVFLFETCTELGVWAIWPMVCTRSVVKPAADRATRWKRTTIEAAKQCRRCRLPLVADTQPFSATVARADEFDALVVTSVSPSSTPLSEVLVRHRANAVNSGPMSLIVWIGPEGGLTTEEEESTAAVGATKANLGDTVLRVETAAVAVAALVALC